jgi:Na+/H+ antiporter NhaD/arsenite permease-like protein
LRCAARRRCSAWSVYGAVAIVWRKELTPAPTAVAAAPPAVDRGAAFKAAWATAVLFVLFTLPIPREIGALGVAALLLISRTIASRHLIAAVDWHLLLLIACLFVVTGAFAATGLAADALAAAGAVNLSPTAWPCWRPARCCSATRSATSRRRC